jgi:hypothetical protein
MGELLPLISGFVIGSLLQSMQPRVRGWAAPVLIVLFGTLAFMQSGEYAVSFAFLLSDLALVCASAAIGFAVIRWARHRRLA